VLTPFGLLATHSNLVWAMPPCTRLRARETAKANGQEQCPSTAQRLSSKRPAAAAVHPAAAVHLALTLMTGTISHPYLGPHQVSLAQTRRHLSSRSSCRALINANSMQRLVRPGEATNLLRRARNVRLVCRLWRDLADAPGSPVWRHVRLKRTEPSEPR